MPESANPVLYIVACGGHTASQLDVLIRRLQHHWNVCVIATPAALGFIDTGRLEQLTGHPVRSAYRIPDQPDPLPKADAIAVVPATFNTINKWAHGISDTLALGVLNEAVGLGLPIIAAPTPNAALARHPAFERSVATLRSWGVTVLYDPVNYPPPQPGTGLAATDFFPWEALEQQIAAMRVRALGGWDVDVLAE